MFIQNKGFTVGYFQATRERIQKIRNTQSNCDEVLERLFGITDINKFISSLEDELFFEVISKGSVKKLYHAVRLGDLTQNDFKQEYLYSGTDGFISFCTMLDIL